MNIVKKIVLGLVVMIGVLGGLTVPTYAYTCDSGSARVRSGGGAEVGSPAECAQPLEERELGTSVSQIINVVLGVLAVVAVLVIIIGGIMYTISAGDMAKINQARNMIQYALIGLIVALLAWALVNFVLGSVF